MGRHFKYLSDDILSSYQIDLKCPLCSVHTGVFRIDANDDDGNYWTEACSRCILTMPLRWLAKDDEFVVVTLAQNRFPSKRERYDRFAFTIETTDNYRRTPCLPNLVNSGDWPTCCNDLTEFIGDAGRTYHGPYDGFEWWGDPNCMSLNEGLANIANSSRGDPASLFRCMDCTKKYWTHNMT